MTTIREQTIEANGIPTHVYVAGSGSAVVLLHGLGGAAVTWHPTWEGLADRFTVIVPDLPGHGRSEEPQGKYAFDEAPLWVIGVLDALDIPTAALVGNSMGGLWAAATALRYPHRVTQLVLEDSAGLGQEVAITLRVLSIPFIGELLARPSRKSLHTVLNRLVYDPATISSDFFEELHLERARPKNMKSWLKMLRIGVGPMGIRPEILLLDRLPKLDMPTLVLWGQQDTVFPVLHAQRAIGLIPDGLLHIFPMCGHWPHIEHAGEFNNRVGNFLASRSA